VTARCASEPAGMMNRRYPHCSLYRYPILLSNNTREIEMIAAGRLANRSPIASFSIANNGANRNGARKKVFATHRTQELPLGRKNGRGLISNSRESPASSLRSCIHSVKKAAASLTTHKTTPSLAKTILASDQSIANRSTHT